MAENILVKAIGSGALWPPKLTDGNWLPVKGDIELIADNIRAIMTYQIGFRLRQEIFGNVVEKCLEEPNIYLTKMLVTRYTREAIQAWEPRIELKTIEVNSTSTKIEVHLTYLIKYNQVVTELDFSYNKG